MSWFYNSYSGELTSASGAEAIAYQVAIHTGTGWHELSIPATDTEAQAAAAVSQEFPSGAAPTTSLLGGEAQAATSAVPGLTDIGDFFHRLTEGSTWVRVGEFLFAGILLYVGIKAVTSQTPVGNAAKVASNTVKKPVKAAVKIAAPETRYYRRIGMKRAAPKTTARIAAHRREVRQYGGKRPYQS